MLADERLVADCNVARPHLLVSTSQKPSFQLCDWSIDLEFIDSIEKVSAQLERHVHRHPIGKEIAPEPG